MQLSATFDKFWNSRFAVPAAALDRNQRSGSALAERRERASESLERHMQPLKTDGVDYVARLASDEPYAWIISGRLPMVWASQAQVISDSPDKKNVDRASLTGAGESDAHILESSVDGANEAISTDSGTTALEPVTTGDSSTDELRLPARIL